LRIPEGYSPGIRKKVSRLVLLEQPSKNGLVTGLGDGHYLYFALGVYDSLSISVPSYAGRIAVYPTEDVLYNVSIYAVTEVKLNQSHEVIDYGAVSGGGSLLAGNYAIGAQSTIESIVSIVIVEYSAAVNGYILYYAADYINVNIVAALFNGDNIVSSFSARGFSTGTYQYLEGTVLNPAIIHAQIGTYAGEVVLNVGANFCTGVKSFKSE